MVSLVLLLHTLIAYAFPDSLPGRVSAIIK
jgi:hypothetical protein